MEQMYRPPYVVIKAHDTTMSRKEMERHFGDPDREIIGFYSGGKYGNYDKYSLIGVYKSQAKANKAFAKEARKKLKGGESIIILAAEDEDGANDGRYAHAPSYIHPQAYKDLISDGMYEGDMDTGTWYYTNAEKDPTENIGEPHHGRFLFVRDSSEGYAPNRAKWSQE